MKTGQRATHNWLRISPLHEAARKGDVREAKKLLKAGADLTARDEHLRSTPLAWAAKFGQLEMVKFLLRRGAPKSLPDDPPWATPLAWAIRRGHDKIARLLALVTLRGDPEALFPRPAGRDALKLFVHTFLCKVQRVGDRHHGFEGDDSVSVGEMAEAVRCAGGEEAYRHISWEPDPQIQAIISSWPQALAAPRAEALGFGRDSGIDEVIAAFIEDDLGQQRLPTLDRI